MCTISVILPTFNRAGLLGRAMESVLAQTFEDFELIVVDDHSTDDTQALVRSYGDPRVRLLMNSRTRGASGARNTGILAARAPWLAFQDSDDEWLPQKLLRQIERIEQFPPDVGVVYSGFEYVLDGGSEYVPGESVRVREGDLLGELLKRNFVTLQAAVIRRACFDRSGLLDEALPCRHDWDLFLRLAQDWRFAFVDEALVRVHATPDSISCRHRVMVEGWRPVVEKHRRLFRRHPKIYADHLYRIAGAYDAAKCRERWRACGLILRALCREPRIPRQYRPAVLRTIVGPTLYGVYARSKDRRRSKSGGGLP